MDDFEVIEDEAKAINQVIEAAGVYTANDGNLEGGTVEPSVTTNKTKSVRKTAAKKTTPKKVSAKAKAGTKTAVKTGAKVKSQPKTKSKAQNGSEMKSKGVKKNAPAASKTSKAKPLKATRATDTVGEQGTVEIKKGSKVSAGKTKVDKAGSATKGRAQARVSQKSTAESAGTSETKKKVLNQGGVAGKSSPTAGAQKPKRTNSAKTKVDVSRVVEESTATSARSKPTSRAKYLQEVLVDDRKITLAGRGVKLGLRVLKPTVYNGVTLPWVKRFSSQICSLPLSTADDVTVTNAKKQLPVRGKVVEPIGCSEKMVLLHFHGGAYEVGMTGVHTKFVSHLAKAINTKAFMPNYRLAPRHPYPAAIDDCFACYEALVNQYGAENIFLSGDSCGGGLAVSVLARAKLMGLAMPKKLVLFSPWLDLTGKGESYRTHKRRDPILSMSWFDTAVKHYTGTGIFGRPDPAHLESISPLNESLKGFPPTLIQTGTEEILLSDSSQLAEKLADASVKTRMETWSGLWHGWQTLSFLPEAQSALEHVSAFVGYQED